MVVGRFGVVAIVGHRLNLKEFKPRGPRWIREKATQGDKERCKVGGVGAL
jgi:hypothetical protein